MIKVENLTKRYAGVTAINNLNFEVEKGEIVGFLGPNGAGKSTTLYMIPRLVRPTTGHIRYKGQDITRLPVVRRARLGIGRKFQTPSLFDSLSAYENLELAVLRAGAPRRRIGETSENRQRLDFVDRIRRLIS